MLKNLSQLEHKVGDNVYHFLCNMNAPLNEVKDALVHFITFVGNVESNIKPQETTTPVSAPVEEKAAEPKG